MRNFYLTDTSFYFILFTLFFDYAADSIPKNNLALKLLKKLIIDGSEYNLDWKLALLISDIILDLNKNYLDNQTSSNKNKNGKFRNIFTHLLDFVQKIIKDLLRLKVYQE